MDGQMNLAQFTWITKRRPCEYSFFRYVGQRVSTLHHEIKTIAEIEPYYTIFTDRTVGTPYDTIPIDSVEKNVALQCELEYQNWRLSKEKDICEKNRILKNIECIKEALHGKGQMVR